MKKRNPSLALLFLSILLFTCQDSSVQVNQMDEQSIKVQQPYDIGNIQNDFPTPEDDCIPIFDGPGDDTDECIGDPGGGVGGGNPGGSTGLPDRFQYVNRGNWFKNLYTSYSTSGTGGWSTNSNFSGSASGAKSNNGPSVVKFNNKLYAYYRGDNSKDIFYAYSSNGNSWSGNLHLGTGAKSNFSPAAVVHTDIQGSTKLYVYYVQEDWYTARVSISANGTSYYSNAVLKDPNGNEINCCGVQDEVIGAASLNGLIYFFYRNDPFHIEPGKIYFRTSVDGINFSAPTAVGTNWPTAGSGIAATVHNGSIYLAFRELYEPTGPIYVVPTNQLVVLKLGTGGGYDGEVSSGGGISTNGDIDFTPFFTNETPGIASDGDKLVVTYKDMNEDIRSFYYKDLSFTGSTRSDFSITSGLGYRSQSALASGKTEGGIGLVYTGN